MKYEVKESSGNLMMEKSFLFALRIVKLYQHLSEKKKEFVLSKQVLRSGTSIGANLEESRGARSSPDFQAKISIAYQGSTGDILPAASSPRLKIPHGTAV